MSNDGTSTPEPGKQPDSSGWPSPGTGAEPPAAPAPSGYEATSGAGEAPGQADPTQAYPAADPTQAYPAADPTQAYPAASPTQAYPAAGGYPQPGYPQGSYPQGSSAQGSSAQGGEQQGGYPQAGYPQGGYPQAGYPQGDQQQGGYPGGGYPGGGYPGAPSPYAPGQYPGPPQGSSTDGVSIAALVTGIFGLGVIPIVLGVIGLRRTKQKGTQGKGLAIAGIVLGSLAILASIAIGVAIFLGITAHNERMDDLRSDCESGEMAACDDLYQESTPGSDDEDFGWTCGDRTDGGAGCTAIDPTRFTYGDDEALDALWDACESGDAAACDELYSSAPSGSDYEEFGATCGGLTDGTEFCDTAEEAVPEEETTSGAQTYGDDPALDALWDACEAGSGTACDDLYWQSESGSAYEEFGTTCGNRVEFAASCAAEIGG
ncbi:DUF4190 domain-containing protein [Cellulomonas endometrii]|uniref:DUF4190 domain-containing protein n=1 Tax=Cellulomonas endometrii TaxID=3036301 RepID=UPI0024ADEBCD|nr:DUF4190 domain-containing protein [Cellulomonas endometrii]